MQKHAFSVQLTIVAILAFMIGLTARAESQTETLLYNFGDGIAEGVQPFAGLISDTAGNLYGTTINGGYYDEGTVFELKPAFGGGWTEHVLHTFGGSGDGTYPYAGLVLDASGNLYGATTFGGADNEGTVFEVSREAGQTWTEKIIHTFKKNGEDGEQPWGTLIFDSSGSIYGTTYAGGAYNSGVVFELIPSGTGAWTEKVIYVFNKNGRDGANPVASLIFDKAGNLYGTTHGQNGDYNFGTVFKLTLTAGRWSETILHRFKNDGTDGIYPESVIFDASGNLFGTTTYGGAYGGGVVFELAPATGGVWSEQLLYTFGSVTSDGLNPWAGLIFDAAGNLYGTTFYGGSGGNGTVFKLTPASLNWSETILHNFVNNRVDGWGPYCSLIFRSDGNLYGTTSNGGGFQAGAVFEIMP
jgi:uncharacterized repeat protein (TIGR03803 family)